MVIGGYYFFFLQNNTLRCNYVNSKGLIKYKHYLLTFQKFERY